MTSRLVSPRTRQMTPIWRRLLPARAATCAALCLAVAPAYAAAANLLPHGSAEDADLADASRPAGWTSNAWGGVTAQFAWLQAGCADGARCLRVDAKAAGGEGDAKWWSDPVTLPKPLVSLQVSVQTRGTVAGSLMVLWLGDGSGGTAKQQWQQAQTVAPSASWQTVSAPLDPPAWAVAVRVMVVVAATGQLDTDAWALQPVSTAPKQPAKVSLTFDDGWVTAYAWLVPEMDKRGLRGTHFIISGYMDKTGYTADYIGVKRVKELLSAGHEVGSHTLFHDDMAKADAKALDENLELSKVQLENYGNKVPGFAWPYGSYTEQAADRAKKTYSYVRTVKAGLNVPPYDTRALWGVVVTDQMTVDEIEAWVAKAEATPGGWLVLIYHRADPNPPADSFVTPQSFVDTLDMLQARNADIRPMGELLGVWQPKPVPETPVWDGGSGRSWDAPPGLELAPGADAAGTDGGCGASARGPGRTVLPLAWCLALAAGAIGWRRRQRGHLRLQ